MARLAAPSEKRRSAARRQGNLPASALSSAGFRANAFDGRVCLLQSAGKRVWHALNSAKRHGVRALKLEQAVNVRQTLLCDL